MTEHRHTPEAAVAAFVERITTIDLDHHLRVGGIGADRAERRCRWNGAAFRDVEVEP